MRVALLRMLLLALAPACADASPGQVGTVGAEPELDLGPRVAGRRSVARAVIDQ